MTASKSSLRMLECALKTKTDIYKNVNVPTMGVRRPWKP